MHQMMMKMPAIGRERVAALARAAGFPADAFGTVQMDVADLNLGSLDAPYGGE